MVSALSTVARGVFVAEDGADVTLLVACCQFGVLVPLVLPLCVPWCVSRPRRQSQSTAARASSGGTGRAGSSGAHSGRRFILQEVGCTNQIDFSTLAT